MGVVNSHEEACYSGSHGIITVEDAMLQLRSQILDLKRMATLTYEEFNTTISSLNSLCHTLVDSKGNYMVFSVRNGSTDSVLWKATVSVYCLKVNKRTGNILSGRCLNLQTFLTVYHSVLNMADSSTRSDVNTGTVANLHPDVPCTASVIFDRIDEVVGSSSDSDGFHECCICMERRPEVMLPCAHSFCLPCIEQWNVSHNLCPTCREKLNSTDDAWVISDIPEKAEVTEYLLGLAEGR